MIEILLIAILMVLIASFFLLIILLSKSKRIKPQDIESTVSSAMSNTWIRLGLGEKIGAVEKHAKDIRDSYRSFEQMLQISTERGAFGELALEAVISDQLPQGMYGIRKRILDGKVPDAYIKSTMGIICIDSKFPLDNYRKMLDAEEPREKERLQRRFIGNFRDQLDKIAEDYVCPEKGSAEFAFAYIHSESVYSFLVDKAFGLLREYTKKGVQVVSPLTISHKIELIKAGVHARKLSEDTEKVKNDLDKLSRKFSEVDKVWQVFYQTHFRNLEGKAVELDEAYRKLRTEFSRISKFSKE